MSDAREAIPLLCRALKPAGCYTLISRHRDCTYRGSVDATAWHWLRNSFDAGASVAKKHPSIHCVKRRVRQQLNEVAMLCYQAFHGLPPRQKRLVACW